jgi:hypothetical protein
LKSNRDTSLLYRHSFFYFYLEIVFLWLCVVVVYGERETRAWESGVTTFLDNYLKNKTKNNSRFIFEFIFYVGLFIIITRWWGDDDYYRVVVG